MVRKGWCAAALGALLMSGVAVAAGSGEEDAAAASGAAEGAFARLPPGAEALPEPVAPPLAGEGPVPLPEGNGTNLEAPAEDRAGDDAPPASPDGALPAPAEAAGNRI